MQELRDEALKKLDAKDKHKKADHAQEAEQKQEPKPKQEPKSRQKDKPKAAAANLEPVNLLSPEEEPEPAKEAEAEQAKEAVAEPPAKKHKGFEEFEVVMASQPPSFDF